jgi:hypothetical protein
MTRLAAARAGRDKCSGQMPGDPGQDDRLLALISREC